MGGGKEDEKVISPMFPRLHVSDTDNGGPRAPPRNKMALYEQLSIPSQKFSSGPMQVLPLPFHSGANLMPWKSSNHGTRHESSMLAPYCNTSMPSQTVKNLHSNSSIGAKSNRMTINPELKSTKLTNSRSSNATAPLPLSAKLHSFQPHNFSNSKSSSRNSINEDDFRVPTFGHPVTSLHCGNNQQYTEKLPHLHMISSIQLQMASEKRMKGIVTVDPKSRQSVTNHPREPLKLSMTSQNPVERSDSVRSSISKICANSSSRQSNNVKKFETLKRSHSSMNQENRNSLVNGLHGSKARLCREIPQGDGSALRDGILVDTVKGNDLKLANQSCLRASVQDNCKSPNWLGTDTECGNDKECGSKPASDVGRHDVLNASMVYRISDVDIKPDDVVGVIGEKQFWKARKVFVNQQRVFSVQVFELHRLIKVQKLIAGSAHLLIEDNFSLSKPSAVVSPEKNILSENALGHPPLFVKPKGNSQKQDTSLERANENAIATVPLSLVRDRPNKELVTQVSSYRPYTGNQPLPSVSTSVKPLPWVFPHPPGNQWLVPVMSPSEGLVYKPYTGLAPPAAALMAPVYGSYGPMSLTPDGDHLNTACGAPPSHQQGVGVHPGNSSLGKIYFPPYVMPMMHPSNSGLPVEQMNPFARSQSYRHDDQLSVGNPKLNVFQKNNLLRQMSQVTSHAGQLQASKECDLLGSTASSPSERTIADALPLFPVSLTLMESDQNAKTDGHEQQARVIKVVPHNPRSATESAARIFRTIQEERRQFD